MNSSNLNSNFFLYIVDFYDDPYSKSYTSKYLIRLRSCFKIHKFSFFFLKSSFFNFYEDVFSKLKILPSMIHLVFFYFYQEILVNFHHFYLIVFFLSFYWHFFYCKNLLT